MRFDVDVPSHGYAWWYIDALSDDGQHGLTMIAFIGSVFSPYYAWARRRGPVDAADHCALNVALYGRRGARWSMTERGATRLERARERLVIGPSSLAVNGTALDIHIDEVGAPLPRRIRGTVRLTPTSWGAQSFALDARGDHRWTPFAPCARVEVRLAHPDLAWEGTAYLDSNSGNAPLENAFASWTWSRASVPDGTVVLYDVRPRAAPEFGLALKFGPDAVARSIDAPPPQHLPATGWRIARQTRADEGGARVLETLEDAPFYSRSLLETRLLGAPATAIHESLDLDRFRSRWVQCLLPFRMPRRRV